MAAKYRTLILNAKHLGHKVFGIATKHYSQALVSRIFDDLGVSYFSGPESQLRSWLDRVRPHVFFGEQFWSCGYETEIKKWADRNDAKRFESYHGSYPGHFTHYHHLLDSRDTLLVINEGRGKESKEKTKARVVVVGSPELDALAAPHDTLGIRKRLGVSGGQPLVAAFLACPNRTDSPAHHAQTLKTEPKLTSSLIDAANKHGWKVVVHFHPAFRGERVDRIRFPSQRAYLRAMQDRGAQFVTSDCPGVVDGLKLVGCRQDELLVAADAVTGSSISISPPAYAAGKKYFYFFGEKHSLYRPLEDAEWETYMGMPNACFIGDSFSALVEAVEHGETTCGRDDEIVRKIFFKLDGKCWKRLLHCAAGYPLSAQESFLVMGGN